MLIVLCSFILFVIFRYVVFVGWIDVLRLVTVRLFRFDPCWFWTDCLVASILKVCECWLTVWW